ncbi:helix-turn-helix domain-containing protein [Hymenobacter cellulosilyticus]|uniref:XRE family transcriptional regulator n=1 Tax=Hymenobacter cellulosilyticus TaxID=2932248 RepID=A0A8T9Q8M3_9BACT|nr:hypothetical protein [Hymenobacter cellulosilyticus]UOQ72150.1 hypothetical protein MUN79_26905 [Hymenobacter cellulosilyticus]
MAISPTAEPLLLVVRTYYGLAQQELADFLGVSRGLVALVETGRRTLPPPAEVRLALLSAHVSREATCPASSLPAPAWEPLQLHQRKCLRQAQGLRQELAQRQTQTAQYQRRLQTLPALYQALLPTTPDGAETKLWLQKIETQARHGLVECGPAAQALLTVRIAALEFEAAEVGRQLAAGAQPVA